MTFKNLNKVDKGFLTSAKNYVNGLGTPDPTAEKILEEKKQRPSRKKSRCVSTVQTVVMVSMAVALMCVLALGSSSYATGRKLQESIPSSVTEALSSLSEEANPSIRGAAASSEPELDGVDKVGVDETKDETEETDPENNGESDTSLEQHIIPDTAKENTGETPSAPTEASSISTMAKKLAAVASSAESSKKPLAKAIPASKEKKAPTRVDVQHCREDVFGAIAIRAKEQVLPREVRRSCLESARTFRYEVCDDLVSFTGMNMEDVETRLSQTEIFHHEAEYYFWKPETSTQLAWYYSTSQGYLFRNAIHGAKSNALDKLKKDVHEPVLDYSGGAGNSILYLALERGMKCQYFGIAMIEKAFAQFRVAKRGLQDMVTFLDPWSKNTDWKFDPVEALPRDGSLGAILANDVLSRIPNYQHVVTAMVESLKVGGVIMEESRFAPQAVKAGEEDTRAHVHNGGITMEQAMGDKMIYREQEGYWEKLKE